MKCSRCGGVLTQGSYSKDKHEILYGFGINYDKLPQLYRKGTTLVYAPCRAQPSSKAKPKTELRTLHVDIIGDAFWEAHDAPATPEPAPSTDPGVPFYEDPLRLETKGLGALVLT